jgi:prenyltransferase beta subunit
MIREISIYLVIVSIYRFLVMKRIYLQVSILFTLIVFPSIVSAQDVQMQLGLDWLIGAKNGHEYWGNKIPADTFIDELTDEDVVQTYYRDTAEVANTLLILNQGGMDYDDAINWIDNEYPVTTEKISRKIELLAQSSLPYDDDLSLLLLYQNVDGGLGAFNKFKSNIQDSVFALRALIATKSSDINVVGSALQYILNNQNTDGGWGFKGGKESNVKHTALSLRVLSSLSTQFNVQTSINNAIDYLLTKQNPDGGFGSSPSTVYETSLVYLALIGNITDETVLGNAITYLEDNQLPNGSWNEDPYSTALALRALHFAVNPPPEITTGTFTGVVLDAITNEPLDGVSVSLAGDPSIATTTDARGRFFLTDVSAGDQTVNLSFAGYTPISLSRIIEAREIIDLGIVLLVPELSNGMIRGTITDRHTGLPIEGVEVVITGVYSGTVYTDINGDFMAVNVPAGGVNITASKAGYLPVEAVGVVEPARTLIFNVQLGTTPPETDLGSLTGRIIDSATGMPVPDAVITFLAGDWMGTSGADGVFTIVDIDPGSHEISITAPSYLDQGYRALVLPGMTNDLGDIYLTPAPSVSTITGIITDAETGEPIVGANVTIRDTALSATTDAAGFYSISGVDLLSFQIKASATGYNSRAFAFSATGHWVHTIDFALNPSLIGEVVITDVSTNLLEYGAYEDVFVSATVENRGTVEITGSVQAELIDESANVLAVVYATEPELVLGPGESARKDLSWYTAQVPAGDYTIRVKVTQTEISDISGKPRESLIAEGETYITIIPVAAIDGAVSPAPSVTHVDMQQPISIFAAVRNTGNVPLTTILRLEAALDGVVEYSDELSINQLGINNIKEIDFGSFIPQSGGTYVITLRALNEAITLVITASLYVGDHASAEFTIDPTDTLPGSAHVNGRISLKGVTSVTGEIKDPLMPLILDAIQKGITWEQAAAVNWQNNRNCYGCHVQTQTIVGSELSRDKVDVDDGMTVKLVNFMTDSQKPTGAISGAGSGFWDIEETTLFAWSLSYHHDEMYTREALEKAMNYLLKYQKAAGYWVSDAYDGEHDLWSDLGANNPSTPLTAYNIISLAKVYRMTGEVKFKDSALKALDYLMNADHTRSIVTAAHVIIGLKTALPLEDDPDVRVEIRQRIKEVVQYLKDNQNADDGYGRYAGGESDSLPTAHAVFAMGIAGVPGSDPVLRKSIQYLLNNQDPSGTWSTRYNRGTTVPDRYFGATTWAIISLPIAFERLSGISAELDITFPPDTVLNHSSQTPDNHYETGAGTTYLWNFRELDEEATELYFDLTVNHIENGESRPIAGEAHVMFEDSYTGSFFRMPVTIPEITGIAPITIDTETDRETYGADEDVTVTTTVTNISPDVKDALADITIESMDGHIVHQFNNVQVNDLNPVHDPPYLPGWGNRMKLTIDSTKVDEDLVDFPVRIHLGSDSGMNDSDVSPLFEELGQSVSTEGELYISNLNGDYPNIHSNLTIPDGSDCSVELDFKDIATGSSDGGTSDGVGLRLYDASDSGTFVQIKILPKSYQGVVVYNYANGSNGDPPSRAFNRWSTIGSIRIERVNGVYNFYIKEGSNPWKLLYSFSKPEFEAKIRLITYKNVDYFIDNFRIQSADNFVGRDFNEIVDTFDDCTESTSLNNDWWTVTTNLDIYHKVCTGFHDMRKKIAITNKEGQQLYVEVDNWDPLQKKADLWVKVPQISSIDSTELYLYYDAGQRDNEFYVGNTAEGPAKNVWDEHYKAVYHFAQRQGFVLDSTINHNFGSANQAIVQRVVDSPSGNAFRFSGAKRIDLPDDGGFNLDYVSVEAYINVDGTTPGSARILENYYDSGKKGYMFVISDAGSIELQARVGGSGLSSVVSNTPIRGDGQWHWVMGSYQDGVMKVHTDGSFDQMTSTPDQTILHDLSIYTQNPRIGDEYKNTANDRGLRGYLSELRVSDIARSDVWNTVSNHNIRDELVFFGPIQSVDDIDPSSVLEFPVTWNTGGTFAGDYRVRAVVKENGENIAEDTDNFTILPDTSVSSGIATDKIAYNAHETVTIMSAVQSNSPNFIFDDLTARVSVTDAADTILFTEDTSIQMLVPGQRLEFKDYWGTVDNPGGVYTVTLEVLDNGAPMSTSTVTFEVIGSSQTGRGLVGTISTDKNPVEHGQDITVSYEVINLGNENVALLNTTVLIVDPDTQSIVQTFDDSFALDMMDSRTGSNPLSTSGLSIKTYLAILRATTTDMAEPVTLASTPFTVVDTTPPVVTPISPEDGGLFSAAVDLSVTAVDSASGVDTVEYRVESGAWSAMSLSDPVAGTYFATWLPTEANEGNRTLSFRATDGAGNVSDPVSVSITVDMMPPELTVTSPIQDAYYNETIDIAVTAIDAVAGVDSVVYQLDSGVWTALPLTDEHNNTYSTTWSPAIADEGEHTVIFRASDKAGNMAMSDAINFTVDMTPPDIQAISPLSGSYLNAAFEVSASSTDSLSGVSAVEYRVDGGGWGSLVLTDPDNDIYSYTWIPTIVDEGVRVIDYRATDNAGNESDIVSSTVTVDLTPPDPPVIVSPPDGYISVRKTVNIVGTSEPLSAVDMTYGGLIYSVESSQTGDFVFDGVELERGDNFFVFTATDMAGNRSDETHHTITYTPVEISDGSPQTASLLVWINNTCKVGDDDDDEDGHDESGNLVKGQCKDEDDDDHYKYCDKIYIIETLIADLTDSYTIVYDKKDFQAEMRNPFYTDILILGDHHGMEDHYADELIEKVYNGMGIISSKLHFHGDDEGDYNHHEKFDPVFGIRHRGHLDDRYYHELEILESPITIDGSLMEIAGTSEKVEAAEWATVAGILRKSTIDHQRSAKSKDEDDDHHGKKDEEYPGIVLNEYGKGKAVYHAFDIEETLNETNYAQILDLLRSGLVFVHNTEEDEEIYPYEFIGHQIDLENMAEETVSLRLDITLSPLLGLYDPLSGMWIDDNPWQNELNVPALETTRVIYYAFTPDLAGTYSLDADILFRDGLEYTLLESIHKDITVQNSIEGLIEAILADLPLIEDNEVAEEIQEHLEAVRVLYRGSQRDVGRAIHECLRAIHHARKGQFEEIRIKLNNLLLSLEGLWYFNPE